MRILFVGAGAVGGYFGGRLLEKGVDVTFLVRERRKQELEKYGLVIHSIHGDAVLAPRLLVAGESAEPFDLVVFSNKAYHLDGAIADAKPYVGEATMILPLLNGMAHMEALWKAFGRENVLGGLCFIETTLNERGEIIQTSPAHEMRFGEWPAGRTERVKALESLFAGANARFRLSEQIAADMWNKYLFIATMSGVTTLFRAPIGPIRSGEYGSVIISRLLGEIKMIMQAHGAPLTEEMAERQRVQLEQIAPTMKSSMQRDMEKGLPIEADHLQGYLLELAKQYDIHAPMLETVYHNLKIYEAGRTANER
ncbi:ketopantoate reductase family protein [Geobacillus zalihae]|uniref:ketopantoate reductase family protein n=1 Tax=Geobacillus zalihae TaxID=213419 RepID=UPI000763D980|nr:ketopantoate reductase family protein [Geobacillus zalihae]